MRSLPHAPHLVALVLGLGLGVACGDDDDGGGGAGAPADGASLLADVQTALGGADAVAAAVVVRYDATGSAFEFQEDPEPVDEFVADYANATAFALDGTQSRQAWDVDADYAYDTDYAFAEAIDGTRGRSEGATGTFPARFGGFGVVGDPMFSTKLAARRKTLAMSSPLALVKLVAAAGGEPALTGDGALAVGYNESDLGFGPATPDIELVVDPDSGLPLSARTLENDPTLGDVVYEVFYADWVDAGGVRVPARLEHRLDGNVIRRETRTDIAVAAELDPAELAVAAEEAFPYDADEARNGYLSSQFHFRTIMQTFPIDFPVDLTESESGVASQLVPDDPDAYLIAGDLQSHYSFAFRVGEEVVIYDAPVNDRRSATVLGEVRAEFSDAPVAYVVSSHNHFDHTGGIRAALAEGGALVVGAGSGEYFAEVLARPSTVVPNPIAGRDVELVAVADSFSIGEGGQRLVAYVTETLHAEEEDYLILYKPATRTIYFNDLVNPGFVFVLDEFGEEDRERTFALAREVVAFVDSRGLDVERYHCTHGFTTQDFDFATVRDLAAR